MDLRLKEARSAKSITQWELSKRLDVHPNVISKWERGLVTPNAASLLALCHALSVSADYLLGLSDTP